MAKSPKRSGDEARPDTPSAAEIEAIIQGTHGDPFAFLGVHEAGTGHVARCFIPGAETVIAYNLAGEQIGELVRHNEAGFFSGPVKLDGVLPVRYRATRAMETWALKRVDHAFTICEGLRADIVARGIPAAKVTVIPNAVDIESFQLSGDADPVLREQLGLAGTTVVGFVGSFYAYEGLDLLLRALPAILPQFQTCFAFSCCGSCWCQNIKNAAYGIAAVQRRARAFHNFNIFNSG